jgi:hypothetical protein
VQQIEVAVRIVTKSQEASPLGGQDKNSSGNIDDRVRLGKLRNSHVTAMSEMGVPRSNQANYICNALSASALEYFTSTYMIKVL